MKRPIKTVQWISVAGRKPLEVEARLTHEDSRFAATRAEGCKSWTITHRRSGYSVGSLLPTTRTGFTVTMALDVIRAWESDDSFDWSCFDETDAVTPESAPQGLRRQPPAGMPTRLRDTARAAVNPALLYAQAPCPPRAPARRLQGA